MTDGGGYRSTWVWLPAKCCAVAVPFVRYLGTSKVNLVTVLEFYRGSTGTSTRNLNVKWGHDLQRGVYAYAYACICSCTVGS